MAGRQAQGGKRTAHRLHLPQIPRTVRLRGHPLSSDLRETLETRHAAGQTSGRGHPRPAYPRAVPRPDRRGATGSGTHTRHRKSVHRPARPHGGPGCSLDPGSRDGDPAQVPRGFRPLLPRCVESFAAASRFAADRTLVPSRTARARPHGPTGRGVPRPLPVRHRPHGLGPPGRFDPGARCSLFRSRRPHPGRTLLRSTLADAAGGRPSRNPHNPDQLLLQGIRDPVQGLSAAAQGGHGGAGAGRGAHDDRFRLPHHAPHDGPGVPRRTARHARQRGGRGECRTYAPGRNLRAPLAYRQQLQLALRSDDARDALHRLVRRGNRVGAARRTGRSDGAGRRSLGARGSCQRAARQSCGSPPARRCRPRDSGRTPPAGSHHPQSHPHLQLHCP